MPGMVQNQKSMTGYIKAMSKKREGDDREMSLPVGYMGSTMVSHGEEFEHDSEFGRCLISMSSSLFQQRVAEFGSNGTDSRTDCSRTRVVRLECYRELARIFGEITCSDERVPGK